MSESTPTAGQVRPDPELMAKLRQRVSTDKALQAAIIRSQEMHVRFLPSGDRRAWTDPETQTYTTEDGLTAGRAELATLADELLSSPDRDRNRSTPQRRHR